MSVTWLEELVVRDVCPACGDWCMAIINLIVNDVQYSLQSIRGETLSALLRERFRLTGTKIGCNEAECGACTVLVDGEPIMSCVYPAERANGKTIVTIEGLAQRVHDAISCIHCRKPSWSMAQCSADSASQGRS